MNNTPSLRTHRRLTQAQDRGDFAIEAQLIGEKGFYDCPVKLFFFGPSDPTERSRIEESLKTDRLVKATELKNTRKVAEARRVATGLVNGSTTHGVGSEPAILQKPEISLESLMENSEAVDTRKGSDAIKALAFGEEQLEKMPKADQPSQLKTQLLPYQLQVCSSGQTQLQAHH